MNPKCLNFFIPSTLYGHSFASPKAMMIKGCSFDSPKPYLFVLNLKNTISALLRYVIIIQITPILPNKLPKSPDFLLANVHGKVGTECERIQILFLLLNQKLTKKNSNTSFFFHLN